MNVFVTGGSGFIGRYVVKNLSTLKHAITVLLLPDEAEEAAQGAEVVRGDITDSAGVRGILAGQDALIHLAGVVGFQSWKDCVAVNQEGTRNIIEEALREGLDRVVHMSSVSVYGRIPNVLIDEEFPYRKIGDPYGDTKIEGEKIVRQMMEAGNARVTILRPTAVYGPGDRKFLPKLVENLGTGRFKMIGSGEQTVDLVHVQDVADLVVRVLDNERSFGKTYNVANPENPSWNEFLAMATEELGVTASQGHVPFPLAYTLASVMEISSRITGKSPRLSRYAVRLVGRQYNYNVERIREDFGWVPSTDLLEGMRACIRELRAGA